MKTDCQQKKYVYKKSMYEKMLWNLEFWQLWLWKLFQNTYDNSTYGWTTSRDGHETARAEMHYEGMRQNRLQTHCCQPSVRRCRKTMKMRTQFGKHDYIFWSIRIVRIMDWVMAACLKNPWAEPRNNLRRRFHHLRDYGELGLISSSCVVSFTNSRLYWPFRMLHFLLPHPSWLCMPGCY